MGGEAVGALRALPVQRTYQSTYEHAFSSKPPVDNRRGSTVEVGNKLWPCEGMPFSAVSSYMDDFVEQPNSPRPRTSCAPRRAWDGPSLAQVGRETEYRTQYTPQPIEAMPFIHMEPVLGKA